MAERRDALGPISQRRVPDHNFHLTLLFLGNQPAGRMDEILAIGDAVIARSFELRLDHWGYFDRPGVVWLGGSAPSACRALSDTLGSAARALGLDFRVRPFVPHLTVFRRVEAPVQLPEIAPIVWNVRDFSLIESISNRPYQVLRSWPLD